MEGLKQAGVLCSEMESATLFVVSSVLGLRAGALFAVLWNQERKNAGLPDPHCMDTDLAIRAAVEGCAASSPGMPGKKGCNRKTLPKRFPLWYVSKKSSGHFFEFLQGSACTPLAYTCP